MKYDFTIPNFTRIIQSVLVPDQDSDGLELELGNTEINIKKPYLDADGEQMGNSIFIRADQGLIISMRMESDFLFTFYRENPEDGFKNLEAGSPEHIKQFAWQIWTGIVDYIEKAEEASGQQEEDYLAFEKQFGIYGVPDDLKKLFEFDKEYGGGTYAESFALMVVNKTGLKTYSQEESFLRSFIEFASATGGGSTYAIWVIHDNLEKCPIVVFGDEGGIHPVAQNIQDLIRLLSYDTEISVGWDSVYFYKNEEFQEEVSENQQAFLQWAETNFQIRQVTTDEQAELILKTAADRYADSLNVFLIGYGIDV
ncbi:hypothetical protein [Pedobacter nutrimenti]|uniref:Uncharacterized protein n=1 Tax=Pedobacter nutrimenti TaxID=1241337 RepID=A0A318UEB8_9SPHI|nr:hypothetical protein [Pedobacter nutrimenti]PYF74744.1 hypothetical protein B0O44_103190 [Pedobacter nutrimenti]